MEKYIEEIIEIILENVTCEHQEIEEYPHGPKFDDSTYYLENEKSVIEKCLKILPGKLRITKEFIEKKAAEINDVWAGKITEENFIRSFVEEIWGK